VFVMIFTAPRQIDALFYTPCVGGKGGSITHILGDKSLQRVFRITSRYPRFPARRSLLLFVKNEQFVDPEQYFHN